MDPTSDDQPAGERPHAEPAEPTDATDPTAPATDGMAPLINNTGADASADDDADASSG